MTRIIASSLLIAGILLIRAALRKKISPLVLYPIWLLAAFRLLMPGTLFDSPVSVMNTGLWNTGSRMIAQEEERQNREYKMQQFQAYYDHMTEVDQKDGMESSQEQGEDPLQIAQVSKEIEDGMEEIGAKDQEKEEVSAASIELKRQMPGTLFGKIKLAAYWVWIAGMLATALVFLWQNLSFYRYLRSVRKRIPESLTGKRKLPVFLAGDRLSSPCLFGLLPAIYIPEVCGPLTDGKQLDFILTHEFMHYRHGDHIWAFVRSLCLIMNWYNPLVWIAARLSLRDGELACDAACIRRLGEESRCDYGKTLLAMIVQSKEKEGVLKNATMMTGGKAFMKRRMEEIARKRTTSVTALIILIISLLFMAGCTYTGGYAAKEEVSEVDSTTAQTGPLQEREVSGEAPVTVENDFFTGEAVAVKGTGEGLNGNLQGGVILLLPGPDKEHGDERYALLISDELYLPDLKGEGCKLEKILEEYTDQEILAVLNRDLALNLKEIEVWEYQELIEKVEEIGGVKIDVKEEEIQHINNYQLMMTGKGELLENQVTDSGEQTLNGIQTAAYLQVRYWPGGYFGKLDRWNQVIFSLLQKEGRKIIDCDVFIQEGSEQSVYLEDSELGNVLLCLQWEEELARFHEVYYPDKKYAPDAFIKESGQAMKEQAVKVIEKARSSAVQTAWLFERYFGSSPYLISLLTNASLDAETQDAWRTVKAFISGRELMVDEEGGRALFQINLVFEDSGVLGLPEWTDENRTSVERFLYLKKDADGWYADGLLHNNLPPAQWWDGSQIQWEIYDFGFSDEDTIGTVTTTQEEYDAFIKEAQEAVENRMKKY